MKLICELWMSLGEGHRNEVYTGNTISVLLNSRLIVYICVMRNFNQKKNALGVARLLSRLAAGRSAPPPTTSVSNYLLWHSGNFTLLFLKRWLDGGATSSSALKLEIREIVGKSYGRYSFSCRVALECILYNCQPERIYSSMLKEVWDVLSLVISWKILCWSM